MSPEAWQRPQCVCYALSFFYIGMAFEVNFHLRQFLRDFPTSVDGVVHEHPQWGFFLVNCSFLVHRCGANYRTFFVPRMALNNGHLAF